MSLTDRLRKAYAPGVPYYTDSYDKRTTDLLLDTAARYPNRVAIDFLNQKTTYAELEKLVRQAATILRGTGVRRGDPVALVMPNCPQHIVALFAINLIGGVAVEHNPMAPEGELNPEFSRHKSKVVVAWENSIAKLSFLERDVRIFGVNLAQELSPASQMLLHLPIKSIRARKKMLGAKVPPEVRSWDKQVRGAIAWEGDSIVRADEPAVMIHTGGTTGTPKAVVLTHKNLCSNVEQSVAWVPNLHEGSEVFYSVLPFFHAFGLSVTLLSGIRLGATLAVFPKFDVPQILMAQKRLPCTFFVGVPPMFERILKENADWDVDLTSMSFTLSGAMPLDAELSERWEKQTLGYVIEGFGMTEASPVILGSPVTKDRRPGALGVPYPSTEIRIVDPENPSEDVKEGEIGELIVKGPQVFHGYYEDPEETAEVLRDGWLYTGDLVQVRDDFVYMADRRKELIISGGFNIYPSQVEDAVRSMPGIQDVAVVGMPGGSRGEDVVAALVLEAGASVTLADIREWAEKSIAHYALPRQIVVVQELPRSQIGKVMRRRVQQQLTELQTGFESRFPSLASQVSEIAEKAGTATAAAKEAIATVAAEAAEAAAPLIQRVQAERNTDQSDVEQVDDSGSNPEPESDTSAR